MGVDTTINRHFFEVPGQGFGSLITRAKHAIIETVVPRVAGRLVGCLSFVLI